MMFLLFFNQVLSLRAVSYTSSRNELAKAVPDHPLFSYPKTAKPQDGFIDVSSRCFANAINRTSWYLENLLGPPQNFDTVAYMGPSEFALSIWQ